MCVIWAFFYTVMFRHASLLSVTTLYFEWEPYIFYLSFAFWTKFGFEESLLQKNLITLISDHPATKQFFKDFFLVTSYKLQVYWHKCSMKIDILTIT